MIWSQINYKSKFLEKYGHLKRCSVELKFSLEGLFELHIARRHELVLALQLFKACLILSLE